MIPSRQPNTKNSIQRAFQMKNLLKFSFESNDHNIEDFRPSLRKNSSSSRKGYYPHAKFRFLINQDIDSNVIQDIVKDLDWDRVSQVQIFNDQDIMCPICMDESLMQVAPQITQCGHIFCFTCFLRHSTLSMNKNKCPVCNEIAFKGQLKSAQVNLQSTIKVNYKIKLKLTIRYKKGNTLIDPETGLEDISFCRTIKSDSRHLRKIYQNELLQLQQSMKEHESSQELDMIPFDIQAINIVNERIDAIDILLQKVSKKTENYFEKDLSQLKAIEMTPDDFYMIFQEASGQLIYLHPTAFKYLLKEYDLFKLPKIIEAPLVQYEQITLDDKQKTRYKFLNHIPNYTDVKFADVDLVDIIYGKNLDNYNEQMQLIRKKKQQTQDKNDKTQQQRKSSKNYQTNECRYENYYENLDKYEDQFHYPDLMENNLNTQFQNNENTANITHLAQDQEKQSQLNAQIYQNQENDVWDLSKQKQNVQINKQQEKDIWDISKQSQMQYTIKKPILNQIKKDDKIYKDLDDYIIEDNDDTQYIALQAFPIKIQKKKNKKKK